MTEPERDEQVASAYRALGGEEPPPALDAAILAAARRRGRRWQAPVAAAATLALAVGVALMVEREEPRTKEDVALAPQVLSRPAPARAPAARGLAADAAKPGKQAPAAPAARMREQKAEPLLQESRSDAAQTPSAPAAGRLAAEPAEDRAVAAAGAMPRSEAEEKTESPEQWLERIAKLREAGRDKEADESLAEFRRRYADYRIPEKLRSRVLPR